MTDPVLRIEPDRLTVEPGGQASAQVTVNNPGTIVETYALDVVGEQPIGWAEVIPPTISVYPQQQETATVIFRPPTGPGMPGGLVPFGVRATSQVDASSRAVVEGELTIGQVSGLQAKLTPVTSSGRWRGRHTIQISNWGNAPARLRLVAGDPDQALGFLVRPDVVDLPLGGTATARLKVRIRKPALRGSPTRLPFQVVGEPDPPEPVTGPVSPVSDPRRPVVDGAITQKPIISRGTVTAATLLGVALIAGVMFALTRTSDSNAGGGDGKTIPAKTQITAKATGPTTANLTWEPLRNIDSYTLHYYDPVTRTNYKSQEGINAQQSAVEVEELKPASQYCFKLRGINGDKTGPESDPVCITTPKTPPAGQTPTPSETPGETPGETPSETPGDDPSETPSPTASGPTTTGGGVDSPVFTPDQWVALVELYPASAGVTSESSARNLAKQLKAAGVPSGVLLANGQYKGLTNATGKPLSDSWVVYVGPGTSREQVETTCQTEATKVHSRAQCFPRQPAGPAS